MAQMPVRLERAGDVGLILIDNPPVNASSVAVRRGLADAVAQIIADPGLRAGVIAAEGRTFVAGADIREFNQPPQDPPLLQVLQEIEDSPKPIVAALHGTALGGGFELALACHARVIAPNGVVGLPEVKLGLIPGAGGTARVPHLAGPLVAIDLAATGRQVGAVEARKLGLVDSIADDPRQEAIAMARELADSGGWSKTTDKPIPSVDRSALDAAVEQVRRRARGAIAPVRAAEAVLRACEVSPADAIADAQAVFQHLRQGAQSRALRHLFFAERAAARMPEGVSPRKLAQLGVLGGGTMGSGIAVALADAGFDVTLVETNEQARAAAEARIRAVYERHVKTGRLSSDTYDARMARIRFALDPALLAKADLVIEAIVEDMGAKQSMFRRLSAIARRDAVLASNTSYLDIDALAEVVDGPERVLGLHFFSPAHVMRLLEVVRGARTAPDVLATGITLGKRLRKLPVVSGVCDGFIGNRIFARWRQQCEYALEDGALPQEVDAAIEAYGFPMGPFAVADMAGLDISWANRKRKAATRDSRERYVPVADWLCERGRFGQKTGAGWYRHVDGKRQPDAEVQALIEQASAARGIARRAVPAEEVQRRVHAAMVNDGARILEEGIADRSSDIDLVLVNGYGYPAWRGGPMHEADEIGPQEMLRRVEEMAAASGWGWEPAPLLREMARSGRRFADLRG